MKMKGKIVYIAYYAKYQKENDMNKKMRNDDRDVYVDLIFHWISYENYGLNLVTTSSRLVLVDESTIMRRTLFRINDVGNNRYHLTPS